MEVRRRAGAYQLPRGWAVPQGLRRRFWLESVLGSFTGVLAILTIFWHDWIETIFGVDPDKGSGTAEWLVVLALLVLTLALVAVARVEWRPGRIAGTSGRA